LTAPATRLEERHVVAAATSAIQITEFVETTETAAARLSQRNLNVQSLAQKESVHEHLAQRRELGSQ